MAIKDIDEHKRLKIEDAWDGRSGELVEDFISRNIDTLNNKVVDSISYDPTSQILTLINKKGEVITSGEVSPAKPAYSHNFKISKILVNGNEVSGDILCLIKDTIQLKVLYSLIAENPLTGHKNHIAGKQKLSIKLGNGSFIDIEEGITSNDQELIIDISKYFTDTTVGTITLKVTTYVSGILEENRTLQATTESISVLNPRLGYVGNNYIVNGVVSFQMLNGGGASYQLRYKLNGGILNRSTSFNIDLSLPGLNKIEVYAVSAKNEDIKTLTINVLAINIATQDTFDSLLVAVNEVSETVSNWEYSKMYRLSLYTKGSSEEFININTKLTNTADDQDSYFNKDKQLEVYMINSKDTNPYCYEEDICYFFGMSSISQSITSNLIVNINNVDIVSFEDYTQIEINADSSFTYTEGANFYYDLFDPDNSNIATKEVLSKIESPDGIVLEDSLTIFRISAKEYTTPVVKQSLSNTLTNAGFTFELDFKSYNISDPNKPILKLGKFILYPTELNWQFSDSDDPNTDKTSRSSLFQEDERTHLVILVAPNFKAPSREIPTLVQALADKSINLVRIFINGVIDREFKYNSLSDFNLNGFNLEIAPEASDIDIYDLRVYNRALTLEEISNNYISTMSDINQKKFFQKTNAITATDIDNNTYISYTLAKLLYNTIVYVMPKGTQYLHQFSATKNTKIKDCTVFVNYVNHEKLLNQLTNEQIARSSGRFTGVELKGLGTSAMKYYWYNTSMKGKFTSHGCYDQADQTYKLPTDGNLLYNSEYYYMPTDPNIGIKKLVGKTNYASSMLSHKIGATKAFHDLWTACVDKSSFTELDMMGRKAVLEEPFLAFYIESDIESTDENSPMSQITPQYLETIDDQLIKFAGFQTWGSGKGDDATSGYDKNITPGYLMLEGAENDGKLANFLTPWMPDCIKLVKDTLTTLGLIVDDQGNTSYGTFDSLDVNFGATEISKDVFEFNEILIKTLNRFIEAYNFVYMHTINLVPYTGTTSLNSDENKTLLDVTKKYYITNSRYSDSTGFAGSQWDVFRYDLYSSMWVPAGLPVLDENGKQVKHSTIKSPYGSDVYTYNIFNLKTFFKENGGTGAESFNNFRQLLIDKFKEGFGKYFHVDDIVFHQAFIKLFAGTDNRAKNTYFKLIDENSKISLLLDDMDTILATDNRGLLKKPYFLLEPSQESNPEYQGMWGGNSAFFEVFDVAYKEEINLMLKSILTLFEVNQEPSIHNWMQKYFYYVLEYYPATAYNHTARLCYECAQIFFDNQGSVGISWQNNGLDPVSQVHGSCLLSEKEFMKKRLIMFLSLAQVSNIFGKEGMGINIKASEDAGSEGVGSYTVDITPYQYLYLGYNSGSNPNLYSTERQTAEIPFTATITIDSTTPLYSVLGARYIKKFDDFSNIFWKSGTYNLSAKRLIEMSAKAKEGAVNKFLPPMINLETPVLTKLDLTGVSSLTTINLDSDHTPKLQEVYLTGTNITNVNLPTGSRLKTIYFPASLKELRIINNPGLTTVEFEGYDNIETVYIDCAKCGQFDVSQFCENIKNSPLKSVTIRNANFNITEEALSHIIAPGTEYNIEGTITIVESLKSTTPKNISFMTKYLLVNSFGNIDSGQHGLVVKYATSRITEMFEYPRQVNAYYNSKDGGTQPFEGYFNINIPEGNNVKIKEGTNPFNSKVNSYLDISYKLQSQITGVSINSISGTLTLTQLPATNAKVVITVNTTDDSFSNSSDPTEVSFKWVAPSIGDFAYADGSFSRSVNPQKTMIGLVYAKSSDSDNRTGTVYIIGKEYANDAHYSWYTTNGANSAVSGVPNNIHELNTYVNKHFNLSSTIPDFDDSLIGDLFINDITVENGNEVMLLSMTGKSDTNAYVKYVNNYMLSKIYALITKTGIGSSGGNYFIKNKEDLNNLCLALERSLVISGAGSVESSLVFPYFYSAYVYEPTLMFANETLNDLYKGGKWFAPSYGELARIIYYRGYSARGSQFSSASNVADDVNVNIQDLGTTLGTPIFSIAAKALNLNFPDCWKNIINTNTNTSDIIGSLNIVTTAYTTATPDSYTYQAMQSSTDYTTSTRETHYEWIRGGNVIDLWYNNGEEQDIRAWAYKKHLGLPFTEFNYVNPLEE